MICSASSHGVVAGVAAAGAVVGALLFGGAPAAQAAPRRRLPQVSPVPGRTADRAPFPTVPVAADGEAMMVGDMARGATVAGATVVGTGASGRPDTGGTGGGDHHLRAVNRSSPTRQPSG